MAEPDADGPMFDLGGAPQRNTPNQEREGGSDPAPAAPGRRTPDGGSRRGRPRARRNWAILAFVLSVVSLGVELGSHLCASAFFDPLPDGISVVAYVFLTGMLLFNEVCLGTMGIPRVFGGRHGDGASGHTPGQPWLLGVARVWTAAALVIAGAYTVMFLPILPFSFFGIMLMGVGGCAWSPLFNLVVMVAQSRALAARWRELSPGASSRVRAASLICAAATAALLVGRPMTIGYLLQRALQSRADRQASVAWLRLLNADPEVLNLCYRSDSSRWVWVAAGRYLASNDQTEDVIQEARRVYYLMTGRPFETEDASRIVGRTRGWIERDPATEQQGGELVGSAVRGLSLSSSRLDGVIDPRTETAYGEWTLIFKNSSSSPQEARAEILLPEGGVVDKVSLWINGEERPAAFGPRALVRTAYEDVAVVRNRDPLLVTARDSGRVMAQCFPVPANGQMKIRLGMTAPLIWTMGSDSAGPRLCFTPPAFQQVNFRLPRELRHQLWLEGHWPASRGQLAGREWSLTDSSAAAGQSPAERTHTARLDLPAAEILYPPPLFLVNGATPRPGDRLAPELVRRESPFLHPARPVDLLLLVDTTADMQGAIIPPDRQRLVGALVGLPAGSHVRFVDVREASSSPGEGATPWMEASHAAGAEGWWSARRYWGGVEPARALAWAWDQAAGRSNPAAVIWLHGATPADFGDAATLTQRYDRRPNGPVLVGVRLRPGPDSLLDELAGRRRVFALTARGEIDTLGEAVRLAASAAPASAAAAGVPLGGREPAINGVFVSVPAAGTGSSSASSRLAADSHVLRLWYAGERQGPRLAAAQKLAIARRLVTPLSGAVVLETREQYRRYELNDAVSKTRIPSVPEPTVPAMLTVAGGMAALAALYRRRLGQRRA